MLVQTFWEELFIFIFRVVFRSILEFQRSREDYPPNGKTVMSN